MSEALLGFDARVVGERVDELWSPERRRQYLLRDAVRPLSVDPLVWPSCFKPALEDPDGQQPWQVGWMPRPEWIGPNDLWEALGELERALVGHARPPGIDEIWKVAISWHAKGELKPGPFGPHLETSTPSFLMPEWTFLGFDVADPRISGLSNCGYSGTERQRLGDEWHDRLNPHHLLTRLDDALDFLKLCDERVPEHAPFFVLGLWRIP